MEGNKTCVLALSSGGARGFAHIGVIEGLLENNYTIKAISGCSMGALVAGVFAAGKLDEFKTWACALNRGDVFRLYDFVFSAQGILKGERVFNEIKKFVPDQLIESLPIQYFAVGTDLRNRKEIVFDSGSLHNAFRASSAIPGIMKPFVVDGIEIHDGGIMNPLPVDLLPKMKDVLTIAVDVCAGIPFLPVPQPESHIKTDHEYRKKLDDFLKNWIGITRDAKTAKSTPEIKQFGFFDLLLKSTDLMQDKLTEKIIQISQPDLVIHASREAFGTFDFHRAADIIEYGRKQLHEALQEVEISK